MKHVVIRKDTNKVANVIEWDGQTKWDAPNGTFVVQHDKAAIGDEYKPDQKKFHRNGEEVR